MAKRDSGSAAIISVIIPVAPGEQQWNKLLDALPPEDPNFEILIGHSDDSLLQQAPTTPKCSLIPTRAGRAQSMNDAAAVASGNYLWFLHADSQIENLVLERLALLADSNVDGLFFHDLGFSKDGPSLMWLNEVGVWLRSHVLRIPFGDQAFFVKKLQFEHLGGFDETAEYGEDHLLIWKAHRLGIPVRGTGTRITTSARKYAKFGWGSTTIKHLLLTFKQAAPEFWKFLIRSRI